MCMFENLPIASLFKWIHTYPMTSINDYLRAQQSLNTDFIIPVTGSPFNKWLNNASQNI